MEENELQEILIDTQKEYTRSNKVKDKMWKQCPCRPDKKQKSVPYKCGNRCWNVYGICL